MPCNSSHRCGGVLSRTADSRLAEQSLCTGREMRKLLRERLRDRCRHAVVDAQGAHLDLRLVQKPRPPADDTKNTPVPGLLGTYTSNNCAYPYIEQGSVNANSVLLLP